jgi:hypothetical protein
MQRRMLQVRAKRPALPVTSSRAAQGGGGHAAMGLGVGVGGSGGRRAPRVDLLGVVGAHANAPGGDGVAVTRLGQRRVDRR